MAAADTARLIASLTLDDKGFTKGLSKADRSLGKLEGTAFRVGQNIGGGIKTGLDNLAKLGVVAAGGIALAVKSGLDDLAELENAVTSVDGAIAQLGLTGQVTGKQVADWANEIERDVDAAFDDKAITQAAASLIRFGKVTPKNLRSALEVMTDLAVKTGDIDSAASLLAKALADPTKAAGKLARVGVVLTKQQQDQIKAMTEAGDVAGAQAVLLDALALSTAGAAKAMAGPYQDAINKTNDAIEDAKKALAVGFLPVITKVADKLSTIAADPKALASIESFGRTLAGGLDHLIGIAENLPWDAIGTSLQIGGMGAKAILDAFVSLPPWVQTAVLTGWGLNKLTGGALSGIVSELAKGAIKGVLGINAGVVQVNAKSVTGVGGAGAGTTGAAAKGAGIANALGKVFIVGMAAAVIAELVNARSQQSAENVTAIQGTVKVAEQYTQGASLADLEKNLAGIQAYQASLTNSLTPEAIAYQLDIDGVKTGVEAVEQRLIDQIAAIKSGTAADVTNAMLQNTANERLESIRNEQIKTVAALPPIRSEMIGVRQAQDALRASTSADSASERAAIASASTAQQAATARATAQAVSDSAAERSAINSAKAQTIAQLAGDSSSERTAIANAASAQQAAQARTTEAARSAAAAIRDKDLSVSVNTTVQQNVSVNGLTKQVATYSRLFRTNS